MANKNKEDVLKAIVAKTDVNKRQANDVLKAIIEEIKDEVKAGNKVQFIGFGNFEPRHRAARKGRNPQTGAEIKIAATTVPAFKAGKGFKDAVK